MSVPEFSFITPTYNSCRFIRRCYWSLCQQTLQDWEWIVVDDASTDGTTQLIREISDLRIIYYRLEKNRGAGVARNHALQRARGSWSVIQDMDDFSFPTRLQQARLAREQGYDFMCSYLALVDGAYAFQGMRGWREVGCPRMFPHGSLCGRTDIIRSIGYPPFRRGEDRTIVLRLAHTFSGLYVHEPLYWYHEDASVTAKKAMQSHYFVARQMFDLQREGKLKSSEAWRDFATSVMKVVCLAPICLWPSIYQRTLRMRGLKKCGSAGLLAERDAAFLLQISAMFPSASDVP